MGGQVREYSSATPGVFWASLYDFGTNSASLESEHIDWLNRRIVTPHIRNHIAGSLWIRGRASRRWDSAHRDAQRAANNLSLSSRRADAVAHYLESQSTICRVFPLAHVANTGDTLTIGAQANDSLDRAVEVKFQPVIIPHHDNPPVQKPPCGPKIPVEHPTPGPIVSNTFRLRAILGTSAGEGLVAGAMTLEIEDTRNHWAALYDVREVHLDLGVSCPVSVSIAGLWHNFTTSSPVNVGHLGGAVRLESAGVSVPLPNPFTRGPHSLSLGSSHLLLQPVLAGVNEIRIDPFNPTAEWAVLPSIGISRGVGSMSLMYPPLPSAQMPWPYRIR